MKILFIILISLVMASCSTGTVLLRNDQGNIKECGISAGDEWLIGNFMASRKIKACVRNYEKAGYKKI